MRLGALRHRLGSAPCPAVQAAMVVHLAWLDQRLATLDDDLDTPLRASAVWRERETLSRRVPGIETICARAPAGAAQVGDAEPPACCGFGWVAPFNCNSVSATSRPVSQGVDRLPLVGVTISSGWRPGPRREFCEPALGPVTDELGQHFAQVGFGIDSVQLAGLDQRCEHSPGFLPLRC